MSNNPATGAETAAGNNQYVNIYVLRLPTTSDTDSQKYRLVCLQPQRTFTSLAAAQAEDTRSLSLGDLTPSVPELVFYERITYVLASGDANTGKCRIATGGISYIYGTRMSQMSATGAGGVQTAENTPFTPAGSIAATDVQAALVELDAEKQPIDADLTTIAGLTPSEADVLTWTSGAWTAAPAAGGSGATTLGTNSNDVFRIDNPGGTSRWTGTISSISADRLSVTVSAPSVGQEAMLVPTSTSHLAKMRLFNSTRANNYGLISNYVVATNVVTLTAAAPADWVNGDTLTITSPTVIGGGFNWFEMEMTSASYMGKSGLIINSFAQSPTAGDLLAMHPVTTYAVPSIDSGKALVANVSVRNMHMSNWTSNVYAFALVGTWTGTAAIIMRMQGTIS